MSNVTVAANELAEEARITSNAGRVLILAFLKSHGTSSWSELLAFLEKEIGPVNPNTLQFHMKVLIAAGWIKRSGSEQTPRYSISNLPTTVLESIPKLGGRATRAS
ncbi:MAG TPA: hypothetical protein VML94_07885 [Thermoplasmata archaeon]|nr:hypothetical protein [Thermoplasmata archaeon]